MPSVEDFDESGTANLVDWWEVIRNTARAMGAHVCHTNANITDDTYPWLQMWRAVDKLLEAKYNKADSPSFKFIDGFIRFEIHKH